MGPRWKGETPEAKALAKTKALADPMSNIVEQLQSSLRKSETQGFFVNSVVLLLVDLEQSELLSRSCFGRPNITAEQDKQWYVMSFEEAFYLCYSLECLKIIDNANKCLLANDDVWNYMKSERKAFPEFYIAYSHLRKKNWVVSSGSMYGVDFVAYRHHPELVHSEFAVVVDFDESHRLKEMSDVRCTLRLCRSVAKTLLVLGVNTKGCDVASPSALDLYEVEERTITHSEDQNISKRLSPVLLHLQSPEIQPIEARLSGVMGPRWKGKTAKAKALAYPMSKIVEQLQSSLCKSETQGFLSNSGVRLSVDVEQVELLRRAFFGQPTADDDKQWYDISFEEAFYLSYSLECLQILDENKCLLATNDVWKYMKAKRRAFPEFYIAYSHFRKKNWVVSSGSKYGADFVAYRHHPELVHSEYVVIVNFDKCHRLKDWSDIHGTVRLCQGVKKTLLDLSINTKDCDVASPSELDFYKVEERTITGWNPKQHREDDSTSKRATSA